VVGATIWDTYFWEPEAIVNDAIAIRRFSLEITSGHNSTKWLGNGWETHIDHAEWKAAAGVVVAIDDVGDSRTRLLAGCTSIDDGCDVRVAAPLGGDWTDGVNNDDGIVADGSNPLNLRKGQIF